MLRLLAAVFSSLLLFGATGCQEGLAWVGATVYQADTKAADTHTTAQLVRQGLDASPRIRVGYLSSPTLGTVFHGAQDLGRHGYRPNWSEQNGIVYTCKAGHIDIAHLRKATDWTIFLAAKTFQQIKDNKTKFSFRLYEPSRYFVHITYPPQWQQLSLKDKEDIAYNVAAGLGQYLAFTATNWHEIITWFGYKSKGFEPEFPSAFTWEETFSNLLGVHVAALALQDNQHTFNQAVTLALDAELQKLDVQPAETSRRAAESVRGLWFSGDLLWVDMKRRNFDIGLDDGFVTPWTVPAVSGCEAQEAQSYPVPGLDFLGAYGFSVRFEIEPRIWEQSSILSVVYPDGRQRKKRIAPAVHFAPIMDHIRQEAVKRYGPEVDLPY
jgi:hypothetical protein